MGRITSLRWHHHNSIGTKSAPMVKVKLQSRFIHHLGAGEKKIVFV